MSETVHPQAAGGQDHPAAPATSMGLDSRKMVIWFFIASEVIFFTGLISTYVIFRGKTPAAQGLEHLDLRIAGVMTFVLLMSSFTMVTALAKAGEGDRRGMVLWLGATALLGLIFLGSQAYEWSLLFGEGVSANSSMFGATFFTLTGFHGTHVLIGIVWILAVVLRATRGIGTGLKDNLYVELSGLYWHFVDLVWVVIFMLVYLI